MALDYLSMQKRWFVTVWEIPISFCSILFAGMKTTYLTSKYFFLCPKVNDGSASVMRRRHLISNTNHCRVFTMGTTSTNLWPHTKSVWKSRVSTYNRFSYRSRDVWADFWQQIPCYRTAIKTIISTKTALSMLTAESTGTVPSCVCWGNDFSIMYIPGCRYAYSTHVHLSR